MMGIHHATGEACSSRASHGDSLTSHKRSPLSFSYSAEQIRPAKSSLRWKTSAEIRWPSLSDTAAASDEALVSRSLPKFALDATSRSATTVPPRGVFPAANDMPGGAIPIGTAGNLLVRQHGEETLLTRGHVFLEAISRDIAWNALTTNDSCLADSGLAQCRSPSRWESL